jgi:hypothetical protein
VTAILGYSAAAGNTRGDLLGDATALLDYIGGGSLRAMLNGSTEAIREQSAAAAAAAATAAAVPDKPVDSEKATAAGHVRFPVSSVYKGIAGPKRTESDAVVEAVEGSDSSNRDLHSHSPSRGRFSESDSDCGAQAESPQAFPRGMSSSALALFLLARFTSGAHFTTVRPTSETCSSECDDPLQVIALELFVSALSLVAPVHVHQIIVMHVLQVPFSSSHNTLYTHTHTHRLGMCT